MPQIEVRGHRVRRVRGLPFTMLLLALLGIGVLAYDLAVHRAFYVALEDKVIPPFAPDDASFQVAPMFYALGAFPLRFGNRPVLYSTRYEKGVPERFIGKIFARLQGGSTLVFEGPKTPTEFVSRQEIRECFQTFFGCPLLRRKVLSRHLEEMKGYELTQMEWVQQRSPNLPEEDRPQGIWLQGHQGNVVQTRWIAITSGGAHQAFVLQTNTPQEAQGTLELFKKTIGSLRFPQDIQAHRAWINQVLSEVDVRKENNSAKHVFLLLSKASVDPRHVLTFYHLGGMAHLLLKGAYQAIQNKTVVLDAAEARFQEETMALMKPLIHASFEFAKDINPQDPNTRRLEQLWIETLRLTNP